jgi:hypothetical protein
MEPHISKVYDYGEFQVVRRNPKSFRHRRPDGNGGWIWNMDGVEPHLYRRDEVLAAPYGSRVYIPEGEDDVEKLRELGLIATCNPGGAGKWKDSYSQDLRDKNAVVLQDNDNAGRGHAQQVATSVYSAAISVRIVELTGLHEKGDVSDWLDAGHTLADLEDAVENALLFPPNRTRGSSEQGILKFYTAEVTTGPIPELAPLLDDVSTFVRRYVVLSSQQADAIALWDAHTHAFAGAETTPYLSVRSPEKRSGKTRLLEVQENLVPDPLKTENISVAALVHSVNKGATLLLDEVDSVFGKGKASETQEMLRGILNSGYRMGGSYVRMTGQGTAQEVRQFKTFGPKMLAGIGSLPGTTDDRSIILTLNRKAPHEKVERFRFRVAREQAAPLYKALARWATEAVGSLRDARPDIPTELDDRAADSWEPLLAIADMAGGDWPKRARDAALALSASEAREDDSIGVRLLGDIRTAFDEAHADRLSTTDILKYLNAMEESPWGGFGDNGMTGRDLARHIKRYGISRKQMRIEEISQKGYEKRWFLDAWTRYCPPLHEIGETWETSKLSPIYEQRETTPPGVATAKGNVSDDSQAQPRHDVSLVSDKSADTRGEVVEVDI